MDGSTFFVINYPLRAKDKKKEMNNSEKTAIQEGMKQIKNANEENHGLKLVCKSQNCVFYYSEKYGLVAFITSIEEATQTASIVVVGADKYHTFTLGKSLYIEELNKDELSFYKRLSDSFFTSMKYSN